MENNKKIDDGKKDVDSRVLIGDNIKMLEEKYNQMVIEVADARTNLSTLRKKNELLPYSNHKKIKIITFILRLFTFFALVNLHGYLSMQLGYYLKLSFLLTDSQAIMSSVISMLLGIPLIGLVDVLTFRKIMKVWQQKSYNKIINSLEYSQLSEDIMSVCRTLDEKLCAMDMINRQMLEYKSKQAIMDAEKNIRNVLVSYSNDSSDEIIIDSGNKTRPYTRRLVKNGNNYDKGSIE